MADGVVPATVTCPCGARIKSPAKLRGKRVRCPRCAAPVPVPAADPPAEDAAVCPKCGRVGGIRYFERTRKRRCRYCAFSPDEPADAPMREAPADPDSRRDLRHESHIRAVAFWTIAGGLLAMAGAALLLVAGNRAFRGMGLTLDQRATVHAVTVGVGLLFGGGGIFIGFGLWGLHAWARVLYGLLGGVGVILQGLGLAAILTGPAPDAGRISVGALQIIWGIACLWVVLGGGSAALFNDGYREYVARGNSVAAWWSSPFFYLPWVAIGAIILSAVTAVAAG